MHIKCERPWSQSDSSYINYHGVPCVYGCARTVSQIHKIKDKAIEFIIYRF